MSDSILTPADLESVERFVAHCRHHVPVKAMDARDEADVIADVIAARRYRALREFANGSTGHLVAIFARNEPDRALDSASELDGFADQLGHVPTPDPEITHAPARDRIVDTREHALRMAAAVLRGRLTMAERTRDDLADILMEYARAEPRDA